MTTSSVNASKTHKDGTPKSRNAAISVSNTHMPESVGVLEAKQSRVKSSRNSSSRPSGTTSGSQPRAATPKTNNKLFQSVSSLKPSESQLRQSGKLNMTMNQRINALAGNSNDYLLKSSMKQFGGQTQQLGGISSVLTQSSKIIPKKEVNS
jgi:hypothetical protein